MTKLSNLFLLAALLMSTIAHIFEQKSIHIQRQTIQLLEATMNKQTAAIQDQNDAIGMCRDAIHRADAIITSCTATVQRMSK